jgi:hypothetical protein
LSLSLGRKYGPVFVAGAGPKYCACANTNGLAPMPDQGSFSSI